MVPTGLLAEPVTDRVSAVAAVLLKVMMSTATAAAAINPEVARRKRFVAARGMGTRRWR